MLSAKQFTKDLKVKNEEELYCHNREMSRATGAKKPSESQEARALLGNEGRQGQGRIAFQRPIHSLGHSVEVLGEYLLGIAFCLKPLVDSLMKLQWSAVVWAPRFCKRCEEVPFWEGVWFCLNPWSSVRLRAASTYWNVPGKYGPHGELFFFLIKKEHVAQIELPSP